MNLRCRLTVEADNAWEPRHVSFVPMCCKAIVEAAIEP